MVETKGESLLDKLVLQNKVPLLTSHNSYKCTAAIIYHIVPPNAGIANTEVMMTSGAQWAINGKSARCLYHRVKSEPEINHKAFCFSRRMLSLCTEFVQPKLGHPV